MVELYLICLGLIVGLFSGLLGIGGGVLMVPALIFVSPLIGVHGYPIYEATGIAVVSALFSGGSSLFIHWRRKAIDWKNLIPIVFWGIAGGLAGGYFTTALSEAFLYGLFAFVLAVMVWLELRYKESPPLEPESDEQSATLSFLKDGPWLFVLSYVAASLGIGGSVMLLPILMSVRHVPVRTAIGAGAILVCTTASSATLGKFLIGVVPLPDAIWTGLAAVFGGYLGARLSHRLPTAFLRKLLLAMMLIAMVRLLFKLANLLGWL